MQHFAAHLGVSYFDPNLDELNAACINLERSVPTYAVICALGQTVLGEFAACEPAVAILESRYGISVPINSRDIDAPMEIRFARPSTKSAEPRERKKKPAKKNAQGQGHNKPASRKKKPSLTASSPKPEPAFETSAVRTPEVQRWIPQLTPRNLDFGFDINHPLAGCIVWARVRFHQDRNESKMRPCIVIAVAERSLLVRGLYSKSAPKRREFDCWESYGLDRLGYVAEVDEFARRPKIEPQIIARLRDEDWNLLR
jgi:hypothetical protein